MASEWLFPTTEQDGTIEKTDRQEELFVFGYACKLFRDDDQARLVDAGKYMIPWMGDDRVKIDRYDGRGHLYDLGPYDADNMKGKSAPVLSEEEKQIEQLCDEERYLELHTDVAEKAMYEEEEWKRYYESLSEGYKAVGFSYDYYHEPQGYSETVMEERTLDLGEVFVPPPELQVPAGCTLPPTHKENAIIEKTAKFIAEHGVQMEIRVKAKQSNNPMFQFMHFENDLHPYYKHMIKMIKSKKYIPKVDVKDEKDEHNDSGELEGDGHSYLHPTLLTTNRASPTPEVYKPTSIQMPKVSINETPYGQLLASMSKVNKEVEEKKRLKEELRVKNEPQSEESSYDGSAGSHPPPPGIEPVTLPSQGTDQMGVRVKKEPGEDDDRSLPKTTSPPPQIVPPPPDAQPVIDRMAMYVAKNGEEFEIVVKRKNDQRFQFLEPWHVHYSYYDFKKHLFIEEMEREKKELEREERKKEKEKADKLAKGVKFKLKKAKEQDASSLDKKKVFHFDDSSEEEQNGDGEGCRERKSKYDRSETSTPDREGHDPRNDELMEKKLAEQRVKDRLAANAREKLSQVDKDKQIKMERKKKAAMFINLLKSKQPGEEESDSKTGTEIKPASASESGTSTPVRCEETVTSRHKSKHKSRDRSRSRDRRSRSRSRRSRSRDRRSRSRDRRSRSKSSSRSKKKRKRSHTPPSAYSVVRRTPPRRPPPPPPPRYMDVRTRYSRSPSANQSSRHRSRSPSRSKSKKKKKSKSPKSKREDSSHRKSSKKKKRRSRSRSRDKTSRNFRPKSPIMEEPSILEDSLAAVPVPDPREISPAGVDPTVGMSDELEDGETRDSSPEPGQIKGENLIDDVHINRPVPPPDISHSRLRSMSPPPMSSSSSSPRSRNRSRSPSLQRDKISRSRSPSLQRDKISRSRSPSPGQRSYHSRLSLHDSSREATPDMLNGAYTGQGSSESSNKNVSSYMLDRVRAIIKASKEAVRSDEEPMDEDT